MIEPAPEDFLRRSVESIRNVAENVRAVAGYIDDRKFPVVEAIERRFDQDLEIFRLEIWSREVMGDYEGLTFRDADGDRIVLAEQVYKAACLGQWRARRIAAHELGHWFLHTALYRWDLFGHRSNAKHTANLGHAWVEDEADVFAVELLMPMRQISLDDSALDLSVRFGCPKALAEARLAAARHVWRREKRTVVPDSPSKLVTGQRG